MKKFTFIILASFLIGCGGGGGDGGDGGGPVCPSIYNGTYTGQFLYEYQTTAITPQTVTGSFQLTVQLSCKGIINGSILHEVTSAINSDPYFGCQGGCTPISPVGTINLSGFMLPENPPTTPLNPSHVGDGLAITFPNKTLLVTSNTFGEISVSADGKILSSSLDPANPNITWEAGSWSGDDFLPGAVNIKYKSWSLTKN